MTSIHKTAIVSPKSNIDDSVVDLANYINTTKATQIILGIFLSVVVAFSIGAIVQFISRLVLSFRFQNKSKWLGSFFGGIAITSIFYFIIISNTNTNCVF